MGVQKEKQELEDFEPSQLHIFLKHISLGKEHLQSILTPQQLKDLLSWCELRDDHKKQILATKIEKLGNMSLIINTILTSTFGAWMGLSGCIGCGLGSYKALMLISIFAFFVSGLVGYMSLNMTKKQAYMAIDKQRLLNLEWRILQTINDKTHQKADSEILYLNSAIFILNTHKEEGAEKPDFRFKKVEEAYEWFAALDQVLKQRLNEIENSSAYSFYQNQVSQLSYLIKKTLAKHVKYLETLASTQKKMSREHKVKITLPFLKVLTNPNYALPKQRLTSSYWLREGVNELLLGLTPTIWGGFASMFVFVGGIPNIARELGFTETADFLIQPGARIVEISLAILVTSYFGFSFLYAFKKGWQRDQLMERTMKEISEEETHLLISTHKLHMLYKVKSYIQKMISVFTALKKAEGNTGSSEESFFSNP